MSLYSIIDKSILLPVADGLTHRGISEEWRLMERLDKATEEQLRKIQNERLQALMQHCYAKVPYYTKLFDSLGLKPEDICCREDLQKLPILTKQMVREHYDELVSRDAAKRHYQKGSTGGSTGTPLKFMKDTPTWNMAWASSFRAWEWYGFHVGEKMMTLGGNSLVTKKKRLTPKDIFDLYIMRNMKRSSAEVDDAAMQAHYEAYMKYKPKAMRGYASSLVILARYIKKMGLPVVPMTCVLTTGEILMPEYRKTLQEVFGCPVYDEYGAGDGGVDAHECLLQDGLHISEERCVIEITDKEGHVLPDGEIGYVTTTDLGNYVFPFLRYQVGDMAYIKPEKCACGRASRVIGQVIGRAGKLLYNIQGVPISPTMLPIMLYRDNDYHNEANCVIYNKIDQFQIRQDKNGDIRILLKLKEPNESHEQFAYCVENFEKHFVGSKVSLEFVDAIPPMPSGKEDYCVSEYEYKK
jgi:phenylacetate-CoA ligase